MNVPFCPSCQNNEGVVSTNHLSDKKEDYLKIPTPLSKLGIFLNDVTGIAGILFFLFFGAGSIWFNYEVQKGDVLGIIPGIFAFLFAASGIVKVIFNLLGISSKLERQQAEERWQQLFYCESCDGFFLPSRKRVIPAESLNRILYR
jgi:hypothetical protein